jgi:hypothetical protein
MNKNPFKNMKVSVKIYLLIILFINILSLNTQSQENITNRDRLYFGGSFSLMFGTYTQIELSPYVGWRFTPEWSVGGGGIFQYYGSSAAWGKYNTAIYGSNLFTKYTIVRDFPSKNMSLFAYSGYEALSLERKYFKSGNETGRFIMHSVLIGGGLRQYLGGRASAEILILYNINQANISPYSSPTIRIGLNF